MNWRSLKPGDVLLCDRAAAAVWLVLRPGAKEMLNLTTGAVMLDSESDHTSLRLEDIMWSVIKAGA